MRAIWFGLSPAARGGAWMVLTAASFAVLLIAIRVLSAKFKQWFQVAIGTPFKTSPF